MLAEYASKQPYKQWGYERLHKPTLVMIFHLSGMTMLCYFFLNFVFHPCFQKIPLLHWWI